MNSFRARKKYSIRAIDPWVIVFVFILLFIGIVLVFNSSVAIAVRDFDDKYYFVKEQLKWMVLGIMSMGIFSMIDYRIYRKYALHMFAVSFFMLFLVFLPGLGVSALGAKRWISIGPAVLQPSELMKLSYITYLAAYLSGGKAKFMTFLALTGITVGLILIEPDMGTSMILLFISLTMYFLSNAPVSHFFVIIPSFVMGAIFFAISSPYRLRRITSFLNPDSDPQGASYQIRQALLAVGSGGLFGLGLGKSRQKYEYLPEANTDSIYAILAEETGFFGSTVFLLLYLFLIWRVFKIGQQTNDRFGSLLCTGIASWLGFQSIINVASIIGLMPLTGVPLPLISYGGSSLVIIMTSLGIVLNVSKHAPQ